MKEKKKVKKKVWIPLGWRGNGNKLPWMILFVLLAAPLSAQQSTTTLTPDIQVNLPPLEITNQITVMSDSAMIANLNANLVALREQIAARECDTCGSTSTVVRVGQSALIAILAFAAWQLKKIADKESGDDIHHDGDTNVEVNLPPHPPKHDHNEDSESE